MPIYESPKYSIELLKKYRKRWVCKECGGWLNLFTDIETGKVYLACNDYLRSHHDGFQREAEYLEENIPARRERLTQQIGKASTTKLDKYLSTTQMTRGAAGEIINTIWKDAPEIEKYKATMLCAQYNLNPLNKHLYILKFARREEGTIVGYDYSVVFGIQSTRLMAHRKHIFSYLDMTPRVATQEELKKILGDDIDTNKIYQITKLKDMKTGAEAYGIGTWDKRVTPKGVEKGNSMTNMASIRSERQAIDRLYPGEMFDGSVDVMDERYMEDINTDQPINFPPEGEIVDAEYSVLDKKGAGKKPLPKGRTKPLTQSEKAVDKTGEENAKGKFGEGARGEQDEAEGVADETNFHEAETEPQKSLASAAEPAPYEPKQLSNIGDLMHAANQRWGMAPSEVEKRLGKARTQFVDLWAEWNELKTKVEKENKRGS